MSETPRTDNYRGWPVSPKGLVKTDSLYIDKNGLFVDILFAQQLERELNAANSQIGLLVSDSKQQERQIEFLQETIQKLYKGAFEQQERIQRLTEAGDRLSNPFAVGENDIKAWTKAKEGL